MRNVFVEVFVHGLYRSKATKLLPAKIASGQPSDGSSDDEISHLLCCIMGARFAASRSKQRRCVLQIVSFFILGILIGLTFGCLWNSIVLKCWQYNIRNSDGNNSTFVHERTYFNDDHLVHDDEKLSKNKSNGLIFVGIMTAKNYIKSRAVAAARTWVQTVQGKVVFFSSEGSEAEADEDLSIIGLRGVDDAYPPQKKSFLMLKYMHDNYIDQYEWFVRADDDIYIRGEKLAAFLYSVNSSKPQFLGQAGLGNKEEFGLLNLAQDKNFCMGGPGIVMSRATLKLIAPHISTCLRNLYSTHEDVEVGRCVSKYANISCTWAFEMQHLFYHNHNDPDGSFTGQLNVKDIHRTITLHPVKNPIFDYRLHNFFRMRKMKDLSYRRLQLLRDIHLMNKLSGIMTEFKEDGDETSLPPSIIKYLPRRIAEVLPWEYVSNKALFSPFYSNPQRGMESGVRSALDDVIVQVMNTVNRNSRRRGRSIDFKEILYGYRRVDPKHGADYILDLLLVYRKHKGRRMTIPVRRHAYLQQPFTSLEFREIEPPLVESHLVSVTTSSLLNFIQEKFASFGILNSKEIAKVLTPQPENKRLHFIVPLAGRYNRLVEFMSNFENVCLIPEKAISIFVMLYKDESSSDDIESTVALMQKYQILYPHHVVKVERMDGQFSRGTSLARGSSLLDPSALVVFMDVDIYMTRGAIERLKLNTILSKQIFYPIVFSGYDPQVFCSVNRECNSTLHPVPAYLNQFGYWRNTGFGIVSMYNSDFRAIGGFDSNIQGWGKEDVDLFDRLLTNSNMTLFRAADPGLIHVFHAINCDANLESVQYKMCLGTKASSYASQGTLARIVYSEHLSNLSADVVESKHNAAAVKR